MDHHFPFFSWRSLWEWSPNNLFLRPWRGSACVQRSFTGLIRWWKRLSALALMKKLTWPLTETHWISLDTMNKWGAKWLNGYKLAEPTVCKSTSDQLKTIVSICLYHEFLSTNSRQNPPCPGGWPWHPWPRTSARGRGRCLGRCWCPRSSGKRWKNHSNYSINRLLQGSFMDLHVFACFTPNYGKYSSSCICWQHPASSSGKYL